MIENFSKEELNQIKKELGVPLDKKKIYLCRKEVNELRSLWKGKASISEKNIYDIIDQTLCNFRLRGGVVIKNQVVKEDDADEYHQMFQEILEIIKKHNREWVNGNKCEK